MAEMIGARTLEGLEAIRRDVASLREARAPAGRVPVPGGRHLDAVQQDVHTLYMASERLDRIARRLDLAAAH